MAQLRTRYKSLTLYPIELGGRLGVDPIGVIRGYKMRTKGDQRISSNHYAAKSANSLNV
jgi:hypothetical protein